MKFKIGDIVQPIESWDEEKVNNGPDINTQYEIISIDYNPNYYSFIGIKLPNYKSTEDRSGEIRDGTFPYWGIKYFKFIRRPNESPFDYLDNIQRNISEDL